MSFSHDRRGQSVVVGTVILFGFLILALSIYQVQFVPAENSEIEFEHSQEVEGDFLDLRNTLLSAGTTGEAQSTSIRLGTRYPQRTFFLNPPAASGTLEATGERRIEVDATIGEGVHENVKLFWDTNPEFNTSSIRYTPNYNEYRGAPGLVYENSLVAAEFGDRALPRSGQTIIRDERVSLTAISGEISENGVEAKSVDSETVSRGGRTIPITGEGSEDIVISLPTAVSNASDLVDRLDNNDFTADGDRILVTLDGSETYRLGLSEVSVDGSGETSPAYIIPVGSQEIIEGQSIGVEVRDKYNNPVEGASVEIGGTDFTTGDDGRVFTNIESTGVTEAIINGGGERYEEVPFTVSESGDGGDPVSGLVAPNEAIAFDGPGTDDVDGGFQLDVENQHSDPIRVTDVTVIPDDSRLNGLSDVAPGNGPGRSELYVESESGDIGDKNVLLVNGPAIGGQYTFIPNDGLTLNLQDGPEKRAYDTDVQEYFDADTEFAGDEVELTTSERATITFAEFYEVEETAATVADVTDERFSVTVGYKKDGERLTRQFVTTVTGDPAGSVNVQDAIEPDNGEFDVTTDNFQSLSQGFVIVENQGSGESTDFTAGDGETTSISAGEVGGLAEGDEVTATLFNEEGGTILDDDTTVVSTGDPEPVTPSFIENQQTAESGDGPNVDDVTFEFEINDPDDQGFQVEFEVENDDEDVTSVGALTNPTSPQTVDEDDGPALPTNLQGAGSIEVRIILFDSDGNEVERCEGTVNNPNEQITLC